MISNAESRAVKTQANDSYKKPILLSRVIFMPVAKVASLSVRFSLRSGLNFITKDEIVRDYMDIKRVTLVRNPFERLVSAYVCFTEILKNYPLNIEFTDFHTFIHAVYNEPDDVSNCHFRSQVGLLSIDNIFLPDVVIDLHEINRLKEHLPIKDVKWEKSTKSNHGDYRSYYDDELIDLVSRRYAADLRVLDYGFESRRTA